jgi:signal transduction histidine kinase
MKPLGIRNRILLAALAPAALVALLIASVLVIEQQKYSHLEQHRRLAAVARQLAAAAEYTMFVGDNDRLRALVDAAMAEPDVKAAAILDAHGEVVVSTLPVNQLPTGHDIVDGFEPTAVSERIAHWHRVPIRATNFGDDDLFANPRGVESPPLGHLLVQVSNQNLENELRRHAVTAGMAALLILFFGVLLAFFLSRDLIRILGGIGRVVEGIGLGHTHLRIERIGTDELGHLAEGINEMAAAIAQTQDDLAQRIDKATESLRHERDDAEAASQARGRFFAAASHDLRQPLQALALFVDRLERDAGPTPLLPRIHKIAQTVQNLQGLLDTLLDYSRLDGKVYRVERRPTPLADVVRQVAGDFAEAARMRQLDLRIRVRECWGLTDPALLHRVLINLVSNAVRYTQHGGLLVSCRRNATHAHIEVWDTGPGIPLDAQQTIFEELVQLDNPERDATKGLGLGLAIVRRTTDLLNHPLQLCSKVGHGSRFTITVPLTTPPLAPDQQEPQEGNAIEHARVLLVLARENAPTELLDLLDGWGCAVSVVTGADEAGRWIGGGGPPDVVVWETHEGAHGVELAQGMLDWLATATGYLLPALIVSNGPVPATDVSVGTVPRLLLARPFRPARLRALLTRILAAQDEAKS